MTALLLLAQAFFNHQAQVQSANLREAGLRAAEKGRRYAVASLFVAVAGAFFFAAILIAAVELGLQIERSQGLSYSGLMVSATLLSVLGGLGMFFGWLSARDSTPTYQAPSSSSSAPSPGPRNELRESLELLAVSLINEYRESRKSSDANRADNKV